MFRRVLDHPFLFGAAVSLVLSVALFGDLIDMDGGRSARAIGLVVFGGATALMLYFTRDRDDVFWFFLGAGITVVASFLVSLKL